MKLLKFIVIALSCVVLPSIYASTSKTLVWNKAEKIPASVMKRIKTSFPNFAAKNAPTSGKYKLEFQLNERLLAPYPKGEFDFNFGDKLCGDSVEVDMSVEGHFVVDKFCETVVDGRKMTVEVLLMGFVTKGFPNHLNPSIDRLQLGGAMFFYGGYNGWVHVKPGPFPTEIIATLGAVDQMSNAFWDTGYNASCDDTTCTPNSRAHYSLSMINTPL